MVTSFVNYLRVANPLTTPNQPAPSVHVTRAVGRSVKFYHSLPSPASGDILCGNIYNFQDWLISTGPYFHSGLIFTVHNEPTFPLVCLIIPSLLTMTHDATHNFVHHGLDRPIVLHSPKTSFLRGILHSSCDVLQQSFTKVRK